jgi:hypothetical protein
MQHAEPTAHGGVGESRQRCRCQLADAISAIVQGVARANQTVRNVKRVWVKEQEAKRMTEGCGL